MGSDYTWTLKRSLIRCGHLIFLSVVRSGASWLDEIPGLALLRNEDINMNRSSFRHFRLLPIGAWALLVASMANAENPGTRVVQELQARYDDTRPACDDGSPAAYCNGVIVRAIRDLSTPEFWNPTPEGIARDGVSASYIRKDVGGMTTAGPAGFIMRQLGAPGTYPVKMRCVFPYNGFTSDRVKSCATEAFPEPCHLSGVVDIPTWQAHYTEHGPWGSCFFEPTAQWFQFNIEVRAHFPNPIDRLVWNEVVFAPWPQDIPEQLPIEALFYNRDGLETARQMQDIFIQATGKFIPVVRVELEHPDRVFFYAPKDQTSRYEEGIKSLSNDKVAAHQP